MIWPFRDHPQVEAERAEAQKRLAAAERQLAAVNRLWPAVNSFREALVTRRMENGFGEELTVAWQPRGRNGST